MLYRWANTQFERYVVSLHCLYNLRISLRMILLVPYYSKLLTTLFWVHILVVRVGIEPTLSRLYTERPQYATWLYCGLILSSYHKTTHFLMGSSVMCFNNQHFGSITASSQDRIWTCSRKIASPSFTIYQLRHTHTIAPPDCVSSFPYRSLNALPVRSYCRMLTNRSWSFKRIERVVGLKPTTSSLEG